MRHDRARLALGWAAARRAGELVALAVNDITLTDQLDAAGGGGVLVHVRRSKTDTTTAGLHVAVLSSKLESTCPTRATLLLACQQRTGPSTATAGPATDSHPTPSPRSSANTSKPAPGSTRPGYSGHFVRAGFVTEMRARRIPAHLS